MGDITWSYLLICRDERQLCEVVVVGYQMMLSGVGVYLPFVIIYFGIDGMMNH